jgi:cytochrome c oxidase subunit II
MTIAQWAAGTVVAATLLMLTGSSRAEPPVHEIQVVASRYQFEPATIQVIAGESVRLLVRSADGSHGFGIPALKIDAHVPKGGEAVAVAFVAPPAGEYEITCSEFCGAGHARMKATLVSVAPPTRTNR